VCRKFSCQRMQDCRREEAEERRCAGLQELRSPEVRMNGEGMKVYKSATSLRITSVRSCISVKMQ
jgi:hypothetical protein